MAIETYDQALAFWFARVNYEQRGMPGDLRELNLNRMRELLARLDHPEKSLRIVHIAGTKGKGSTAAMLAAILQQAGLLTGLFTSPHLCRVEERVQVDGGAIGEDELTRLMRTLEPHILALDAAGMPPTFFEIVTAVGLLQFARRNVDVAVLEVGLGGRFDATNVCLPLLAVITSISFDHVQQLGPTLASIAREKAGIIKPGRPTISGATAPEARDMIAGIAKRRGSALQELGRDFHYRYAPGAITNELTRLPHVAINTAKTEWPPLELALLGEHQAANAAVTVACIEELRQQGLEIPDAAVRAGLKQVQWPARMEVVGRRPLVILDCAHNIASVQALIETLQTSFPPSRRALIFAGSRDKDLAGMVPLLAPHFERVYLTSYTGSRRAVEVDELLELWKHHGGNYESCAGPVEAWQRARRCAGPQDLICISGSVFLAGELRPLVCHD